MASSTSGISVELRDFLKLHPKIEIREGSNIVICRLTGHEMPGNLDIVKKHTEGKKYRRLKDENNFDYEIYKPHLVPSYKRGHEQQLFCLLTLRHINKQPSHVEKHVNGKRYRKALDRYKECQRTGEVFKAKLSNKKPKTDSEPTETSWQNSESEKESDNESDNMSDLYPEDFFKDEEKMEETNIVNAKVFNIHDENKKTKNQKSKKRKHSDKNKKSSEKITNIEQFKKQKVVSEKKNVSVLKKKKKKRKHLL
ncbi:surfeit locus protein 2-like [Saccoglossus kowalevskii]|uniref:Surfeit locus protein 2-like n=1 Tax=Saccoglossus kowalevskii TaxID=10224 RepID=A0ABM0H105_SACKO|nr:PREDICTED: surfeit locus protein 2-like [Saccoglossus kowalevskii]